MDKYNESLNRAKHWYANRVLPQVTKGILEKIFPELKESKGERIRKAIIKILANYDPNNQILIKKEGVSVVDLVDWLEKQGEHANFRDKIQIGDKVTRNEDGLLVNLSQLDRVAKPADKAEPKFKIGDWVVNGHGFVMQITGIKDDSYKYLYNGKELSASIEKTDDSCHIWNISDARDGDVLTNWNNTIFVFNCIDDNTVKFYCAYNKDWDKEFKLADKSSHVGLAEQQFEYKPATKEQRDTLMKAMADAGYTFDFDKKELRKIEQKSVEVPPIKGNYYMCINEYATYDEPEFKVGKVYISEKDGTITSAAGGQWPFKDAKDFFRLITHQEVLSLLNQEPAEWSEEDEEAVINLFQILGLRKFRVYDDSKYLASYLKSWVEKLKSLRLQPKVEWSKEDEKMRDEAIQMVEANGTWVRSKDAVKQISDWLKSLRPQKKQEWNEQDVEMIEWLIRCCEKEHEELCNDKYGHQEIVSDLKRDCRKKWDWLESLKDKVVPQKQWKPSERQINAFKMVYDWYNRNFMRSETLDSLYKQLKQL